MLTIEPDMVFTLSPCVTGAGLPPVGGGPGGREGRVRVRLPEDTLSFTTEFLKILAFYSRLSLYIHRCCVNTREGHGSSLMHFDKSWEHLHFISIFSQSIATHLELGLDVLTGRALRGGGGGILTGASSEK